MEPVASPDLNARLDRLERGSRRDRAIGFAVLALLFVTAQAPGSTPVTTTAPYTVRNASGASATLSATGLTVRDAQGNVRVFEGIDSGGRPSLDMRDTAGTLRESMYLLDGRPLLRLFDSSGKRREEVGLDDKGDGLLQLNDASEKLRLEIGRATGGNPNLSLYGSDEKLRAYIATDDVSPYMVMRDAAGNDRVTVGGYTDGTFGIGIKSETKAVLWKAP
jgi:hypothetical protein